MNKAVKKLRKLKDQLDKIEEKEDEILSNIDLSILPFEKLTFANRADETNIRLYLDLNLNNFSSIIFLEIPRKLTGFTVLSVETEKIFFKEEFFDNLLNKKLFEFVLNIYLIEFFCLYNSCQTIELH